MFRRWLPREEKFFSMLKEHSRITLQASEEFRLLLMEHGKKKLDQRLQAINDMEHKCDDITHQIIDALNRSFITPIDREDIHQLAIILDDIIDMIDELSEMIMLYKIKSVTRAMANMSKIAIDSIKQVDRCIAKLGALKETDESIEMLHKLENDGDELYAQGIASLFDNSMPAIDVIKLKDVYDRLEGIVDKCEDIAHVIQNIAVKNA